MERRNFIKLGMGTALGSLMLPLNNCQSNESITFDLPYVGISTHAFRNFSLHEAFQNIQKFGINNVSIHLDHMPYWISEEEKKDFQDLIRETGIQPVSYGIVNFEDNPDKNREIFQFVRDMEINLIIANPSKEALMGLYDLAGEFGIGIAIANGGPGSRWVRFEDIINAWPYRAFFIGTCVNIENYLRTNQKPVTAIRHLNKRIFSVYLNAYENTAKESVNGRETLNIGEIKRALKIVGYQLHLILDTSFRPENPVPILQKSLAEIDKIFNASKGIGE